MFALNQFQQLPVDTVLHGFKLQERPAIEQACKVQGGVIDQQIHLEHKRLADGFTTGKRQDLKGVGQARYIQPKGRLVDWIEHRRFSTGGAAEDSR